MSEVSIYPHIKESKKSETVLLSDVFDYIKSGTCADQINEIREKVKKGAPKKEIELLKQKLPYFTGSGIFSERTIPGLIKHNGKLVIDFDEVENTMSLSDAYEVLSKDPYTEYLSLSSTGTGYFLIVNIDPTKHLESFHYLKDYYKQKYNLPLDKGCNDVTRARYISYDPNLFHNPQPRLVVVPTNDNAIYAPVGNTFDNSISIDSDDEKYDWCKKVHEKKELYVTGNRHHYINVFAFFLNKAGVSHTYALNRILSEFVNAEKGADEYTKLVNYAYQRGLDDHGTFKINKAREDMPPEYVKSTTQVYAQAHSINRAGRDFGDEDIRSFSKQYDISPDIVRGIFKSVFEKNKDEFGIDDKPDIAKVEVFIKKRWEIFKNEITNQMEGRSRHSKDKFDLINIDQIQREMLHSHFKFPLDKLKSLLRSDYVPKYNPFLRYFESLPAPDEDLDHIDLLSSHVKTDNQEFWRIQFKKALVRCIACSIDLRVNRIVMTLVGEKEETGKSTFLEFLCPPALKDYYTESPLDNSKDSEIQLSENFFWNLEELASLNAIELNKFKAIVSKISVKQRAAYAPIATKNPRRVNFWAATNKLDFLTDDQNTRWLCFNVESINFDYNNVKTKVKNVDIDKVWSQAWHLYKSGFDYSLTKEEVSQRELANKEFESSSLEKELIMQYFKPAEFPYGEFMCNSDIMLSLAESVKYAEKMNIYAVSRAMKQLGFKKGIKKINGRTMRGYQVTRVDALNTEIVVTPEKKPF